MKYILLAFLALLLPATAAAQDPYVIAGVGLGAGYGHNTYDRGNWDAEFRNDKENIAGMVGLGLDGDDVRFQIDAMGYHFEPDVAGSVQPGNKGKNNRAADGERRSGRHDIVVFRAMPGFEITDNLIVSAGPNLSRSYGTTRYTYQPNAGWLDRGETEWQLGVSAAIEYQHPVGPNTALGVRAGVDRVTHTSQMLANSREPVAETKNRRDLSSILLTIKQKL